MGGLSRPTLSKGDIVVMDHVEPQGAEVETHYDAGTQSRYSALQPRHGPHRKSLLQLKAFLRKIAERTVAGLITLSMPAPTSFKPPGCANYFKACGYDTD